MILDLRQKRRDNRKKSKAPYPEGWYLFLQYSNKAPLRIFEAFGREEKKQLVWSLLTSRWLGAFIPEGLTNSHVLARLYRVCVNSKPMIFLRSNSMIIFSIGVSVLLPWCQRTNPEASGQGLFLHPWKLRKCLCLRIANRCAKLSSTAQRRGIYLFYYRCKKYAGCKHLISNWRILLLFWYSFSSV